MVLVGDGVMDVEIAAESVSASRIKLREMIKINQISFFQTASPL